MMSARAREQLRQEQETFDLAKVQNNRWFTLRLAMGYAAIVLLPAIALVASYIVLSPAIYSTTTVSIATTALLVDMLGLLAAIFKLVLRPDSLTPLKPVTPPRSQW